MKLKKTGMASISANILKANMENTNHTIIPIDFFIEWIDTKDNSKEVKAIPLSEVYEVITKEGMSAFGFEKIGEDKWRNKELEDVPILSTNN